MISSTAEYALRAVVHLGTHPETPAAAQQIAEATRVPAGYLSKVLHDLAKAGIVNSARGPKGGYSLARPPSEISILDVINAVDPFQRIRMCPLGIPEHGTRLCKLHRRLDEALESVERVFAGTFMTELLSSEQGKAECSFPLKPTVNGGK